MLQTAITASRLPGFVSILLLTAQNSADNFAILRCELSPLAGQQSVFGFGGVEKTCWRFGDR